MNNFNEHEHQLINKNSGICLLRLLFMNNMKKKCEYCEKEKKCKKMLCLEIKNFLLKKHQTDINKLYKNVIENIIKEKTFKYLDFREMQRHLSINSINNYYSEKSNEKNMKDLCKIYQFAILKPKVNHIYCKKILRKYVLNLKLKREECFRELLQEFSFSQVSHINLEVLDLFMKTKKKSIIIANKKNSDAFPSLSSISNDFLPPFRSSISRVTLKPKIRISSQTSFNKKDISVNNNEIGFNVSQYNSEIKSNDFTKINLLADNSNGNLSISENFMILDRENSENNLYTANFAGNLDITEVDTFNQNFNHEIKPANNFYKEKEVSNKNELFTEKQENLQCEKLSKNHSQKNNLKKDSEKAIERKIISINEETKYDESRIKIWGMFNDVQYLIEKKEIGKNLEKEKEPNKKNHNNKNLPKEDFLQNKNKSLRRKIKLEIKNKNKKNYSIKQKIDILKKPKKRVEEYTGFTDESNKSQEFLKIQKDIFSDLKSGSMENNNVILPKEVSKNDFSNKKISDLLKPENNSKQHHLSNRIGNSLRNQKIKFKPNLLLSKRSNLDLSRKKEKKNDLKIKIIQKNIIQKKPPKTKCTKKEFKNEEVKFKDKSTPKIEDIIFNKKFSQPINLSEKNGTKLLAKKKLKIDKIEFNLSSKKNSYNDKNKKHFNAISLLKKKIKNFKGKEIDLSNNEDVK